MGPLAGQVADPAAARRDGQKIIARARRTTTTTATTTEAIVLLLPGVQLKAGRIYKIWTTPLSGDTTANNLPGAQMRYTTDGTTPSTSSPILPGSRCEYRQVDASFPESMTIQTTYAPSADEEFSVGLTCLAVTGSSTTLDASATKTIDLYVEDAGVDPGNTGVAL